MKSLTSSSKQGKRGSSAQKKNNRGSSTRQSVTSFDGGSSDDYWKQTFQRESSLLESGELVIRSKTPSEPPSSGSTPTPVSSSTPNDGSSLSDLSSLQSNSVVSGNTRTWISANRSSIPDHAIKAIEELTSLHVPENVLFGRDEEIRKLKNACDRVALEPGHPELVLISGTSGVGKSALAMQLKQYTGGKVFQGKFGFQLQNQHQNLEAPYHAIMEACEQLCAHVYWKYPKLDQNILKAKLIEAFGATELDGDGASNQYRNILTDMIPSLRKLLNRSSSSEQEDLDAGVDDNDLIDADQLQGGSPAQRNRLTYLFRCMMNILSCYLRPLVLVIDDLQWADSDSLELLSKLLTDVEKSQLLVIGTYRDNEAEAVVDPWLKTVKEEIAEEAIQELRLNMLSADSVNDLVSRILKMEQESTDDLAKIVHRKTNGNPFFVLQFLTSLKDSEFLDFHLGKMKWRWNLKGAEELFVTDNVLQEILEVKLQHLAPLDQYLCQVAACIGTGFAEQVLLLGAHAADESNGPALLADENEVQKSIRGLLVDGIFECSVGGSSLLHFAHDQIQFAATCMRSPEIVRVWKGRIGKKLLFSRYARDSRWLNTVADLCNNQIHSDANNEYRTKLIQVNALAGSQAMKACAYPAAQGYFDAAILLLEKGDGDTNQLSLLHSTIAEACYCSGDFITMKIHLDKVINRSDIPIAAKLRPYSTLVVSLSAQAKWDQCITTGLALLRELGMKIPRPSTARTVIELVKTRRLVSSCSFEKLCNLPLLQDETAIYTERIMDILATATYISKSDYFALLTLRHVQMCIRRGVGTYSPVPFALLGCILCGLVGNLKEGFKMGQVAMAILKRLPNRDCASRTLLLVNAFVAHWGKPAFTRIKEHHRGYEIGMPLGDVESALFHLMTVVTFQWSCGVKLEVLEQDGRRGCNLMTAYSQLGSRSMCAPFWQASLNLMGRSADPLILNGEAMRQTEALKQLEATNHAHAIAIIYSLLMQLAYFMGTPQAMEGFLDKSKELEKVGLASCHAERHMVVEGMVAYLLAERTGERRKWKRHANAIKRKVKSWAKQGNSKSAHAFALLEAESRVLDGKREKAKAFYEQAISLAGKTGYQHDRALGHERAGLNCLALGDMYWAKHHLSSAHECYLEWGAKAKAKQMLSQHSDLCRKSTS